MKEGESSGIWGVGSLGRPSPNFQDFDFKQKPVFYKQVIIDL